MKMLVLSDTHNATLDFIVDKLKESQNIDMLIHCGDKYNDIKFFGDKLGIEKFYGVAGNCDPDGIADEEIFLEICNKKIFITHGHLYGVKTNLEKLKKYAKSKNADIVIFGHTHMPFNEEIDKILFFNPGSTILPRGDFSSYGILEITDESVTGYINKI